MKKRNRILLLAILLGGCYQEGDRPASDGGSPTDPGASVSVSPATNCAPTQVAGEIQITDSSQPSSAITRVSGTLFNPTGASVCSWSISREDNETSTATCRNLATVGTYSFSANIHLNTGQAPTAVEGSCTLASAAFAGSSG